MSAILPGDAKRREHTASGLTTRQSWLLVQWLEGQGNTQEAGNQGSIAWRLEPGCVGLNPGCVALDGLVALSELQLHLKVGRIAERPGFPTLKEISRH